MMVYICTKFHKNILNGIRVRSGHENLTDGQTDRRADGQTDGRRARHNKKVMDPFLCKKCRCSHNPSSLLIS